MSTHLPAFIGLGGAIPDVSLVHAYLTEHPDIVVLKDETHFFSSDRISKGKEWYEQQFAHLPAQKVRGELSTSYMLVPGTAPRIARDCPGAQLFGVVRNPLSCIAVLYGEYVHKEQAKTQLSLESYLEQHPKVLERFRFGHQLTSYFAYYSPVNLSILTYEDMVSEPLRTISALYKHLNVAPYEPKALRTEEEPKHRRLYRLGMKTRIIPLVKAVRSRIQTWRTERLPKSAPLVELSERERQLLIKFYEKDIGVLSALLHRDFMAEWELSMRPVQTKAKKPASKTPKNTAV